MLPKYWFSDLVPGEISVVFLYRKYIPWISAEYLLLSDQSSQQYLAALWSYFLVLCDPMSMTTDEWNRDASILWLGMKNTYTVKELILYLGSWIRNSLLNTTGQILSITAPTTILLRYDLITQSSIEGTRYCIADREICVYRLWCYSGMNFSVGILNPELQLTFSKSWSSKALLPLSCDHTISTLATRRDSYYVWCISGPMYSWYTRVSPWLHIRVRWGSVQGTWWLFGRFGILHFLAWTFRAK